MVINRHKWPTSIMIGKVRYMPIDTVIAEVPLNWREVHIHTIWFTCKIMPPMHQPLHGQVIFHKYGKVMAIDYQTARPTCLVFPWGISRPSIQ